MTFFNIRRFLVLPSLELSKNTTLSTSHEALFSVATLLGGNYEPCVVEFHGISQPTLWRYGDLNPRPMACKATALATELYPRGHGIP